MAGPILTTRNESRRWTLIVLAVCLIATVIAFQTRGWIWLGVAPIGADRPPFSDTAAQLFTANACNEGLGQWVEHVCFVPSMEAATHSQAYEPWLSLQRWGLRGEYTVGIGTGLAGLFYLAICLVFRPRSGGEAMLLLALLLSAPVQLAIERANFDLLTGAMLCLAARCVADRRPVLIAAGCVVLGASTSLKLYTAISCACAWLAGRFHRSVARLSAAASTVAAVAILGPANIAVLGRGAPEGGTRFSTGAHWLLLQRGVGFLTVAILCAVAISVFAWQALRRRTPSVPFAQRHPYRSAALQLAFLTAVPLFLLKDSYDYRFVLWLPCLALPMALLRERDLAPAWRRFATAILALGLVVFCAELPCALLDRVPARFATGWRNGLVEGLVLVKQGSVWVLAGLLAVLFAFCLPAQATERTR